MRRILTLAFILALLCGCGRRVVYVPVETLSEHTDTLYRSVWRTDSVIDRDTVLITPQGSEITKWRWRVREVHDTLWHVASDTVRVSVPYPVERELSRWERVKMDLGGIALGLAFVGLGFVVVWLIKKRLIRKEKK